MLVLVHMLVLVLVHVLVLVLVPVLVKDLSNLSAHMAEPDKF